ncbi:MAG: B12-binding domain-containing radical SAM protein [Opitutales bacterium]|jgi:radical SAM superfamily enzyme YgiQ (UPF0313 family)
MKYSATSRRRILCVFPRYSKAFGTFNHAFPLIAGVKAFMPPQGILLIAALLPEQWETAFVDENIRPVTAREIAWSDAVFISGMHIQREQINDISRRAQALDKITILGGPSVSAAPEYYPTVDVLHCGEVGDATQRLIEYLDRTTARPGRQLILRTVERLPMDQFPSPSYDLIQVSRYLLGSVQFSSGCPFTCEFCDIPGLYGRNPRLKTPRQIIGELDQLADGGAATIYFVDDNFIGNPKAAQELLPHLVEWQKRRDYQVRLSCEATLNMAQHPKILAMMREAYFTTVFFGIETPEAGALKAIRKMQNLRTPILDAVKMFNQHGIEVAAGIIMGMDTDTELTPQAIMDFVETSQIPILTPNILYALPKTALYDRLHKAGRINSGEGRDSNIDFLRPYEEVVNDWRRVVRHLYDPVNVYRRYMTQTRDTYPNRMRPVNPASQATAKNLQRALGILARIILRVGIKSDYRAEFWKMAWAEGKRGKIENVIEIALVAHHLITFAREVATGEMQASNYSPRKVDAPIAAKSEVAPA